jgi:hypothetical protein
MICAKRSISRTAGAPNGTVLLLAPHSVPSISPVRVRARVHPFCVAPALKDA